MILHRYYHRTQRPGIARAFVRGAGLCLLVGLLTCHASVTGAEAPAPQPRDPAILAADIPHLSDKGRDGFIGYSYAGRHKAFALAPGGAWAWHEYARSEGEAAGLALGSCKRHTRQKCMLYSIDDQLVFDAEHWPTLWGPYASDDEAARAETGKLEGQRFYDLAFTDASGRESSIAALRGKLVFVHFWGPWCPPCLREFPSLAEFHQQLETALPGQVAMVILQVRDSFEASEQWVKRNGFTSLPLADSGVTDSSQTELRLADGTIIADRELARHFPTSYILDRNGLVLFSHTGPVEDWSEYLAFMRHAAAGKNIPWRAQPSITD